MQRNRKTQDWEKEERFTESHVRKKKSEGENREGKAGKRIKLGKFRVGQTLDRLEGDGKRREKKKRRWPFGRGGEVLKKEKPGAIYHTQIRNRKQRKKEKREKIKGRQLQPACENRQGTGKGGKGPNKPGPSLTPLQTNALYSPVAQLA